jgi:hypothetical protein
LLHSSMCTVPAPAMEARARRTRKRRFAMSRKMTRVLVALLLLVTFTAGAAPAAPWSLAGEERSPIVALWEWIAAWFESVEEGPHMDPDGLTGDEGSHMDPNG